MRNLKYPYDYRVKWTVRLSAAPGSPLMVSVTGRWTFSHLSTTPIFFFLLINCSTLPRVLESGREQNVEQPAACKEQVGAALIGELLFFNLLYSTFSCKYFMGVCWFCVFSRSLLGCLIKKRTGKNLSVSPILAQIGYCFLLPSGKLFL